MLEFKCERFKQVGHHANEWKYGTENKQFPKEHDEMWQLQTIIPTKTTVCIIPISMDGLGWF
jgi:hypothetical protein